MKYVLVFVLLACVLSASIKELMETAAAKRAQENGIRYLYEYSQEQCDRDGGNYVCGLSRCHCEIEESKITEMPYYGPSSKQECEADYLHAWTRDNATGEMYCLSYLDYISISH